MKSNLKRTTKRAKIRTYRSLRCKQTRGMEDFCHGQCGPGNGLGFCGTDVEPPYLHQDGKRRHVTGQ